jgi:methionine-rich copper-binding protein CopC
MRRISLVAIALCLLFSGRAQACAVLKKASPRVGSTVSGPLDTVSLRFSMQIFPADSRLSVLDSKGNTVSVGKVLGDPSDNTVIATDVRSLPPGRYEVVWNVLAACGSHEPGDFRFSVAPPGTTASTH